MHSKNIMHRDIKSQNIFITRDDILKLGDFGIAKQLESTLFTGTVTGTPYNMAPEVCKGNKYGFKADVWSVGIILYELITLKKPFDGSSVEALFYEIMHKQLDPFINGVDSNLQMLCNMMLNKDIDARATMQDIAKLPCMRKQINKWVTEHNCKEEVQSFYDLDQQQSQMPEIEQLSIQDTKMHVS